MGAAIFWPNGKSFVDIMSIFMSTSDFLVHFRFEQKFAYILIF